ncbi:hypothetical protein ELE51_26390, partial [Klebsiella pneumoniae]|nr:hypothetical protein [Klebsiella pneumoniae]MBL1963332.1 hypothetical protein [Klebsiella pneumoniae]
MGTHQSDRRLPLAQQHQGRRRQVQTVATTATGLTCFIFRFLRRSQHKMKVTEPGLNKLIDNLNTLICEDS